MSGERPIPRLALTREEAAVALGMSLNSFIRHVARDLPVVRRGRLRLYPVSGLERWVRENQEQAGAA
ncbi:MAG TPA: helix-turn-helix domain-containing protein [Gemmatimonadaceae bacterium]|nr:helix-turn-helix domain-containing protein [Gemmatimonadaceae bacterium]